MTKKHDKRRTSGAYTLEAVLFGRKNAKAPVLPPSYELPDTQITRALIQNRELVNKLARATEEIAALRALYAQVCQSAGLPQSVLDAAAAIARLYGTPPTGALNPIEYRRMMVFYALEAKAAGANMSAFYRFHGITHDEVCAWAKGFRTGTPMRLRAGRGDAVLDAQLVAMTRKDAWINPPLKNPEDRQPPPPIPAAPRSIYQDCETPRQKSLALRRAARYSLPDDETDSLLIEDESDQGGDKCE